MLGDEVFWKVVGNNLWFAVGTIPASIALALLMAVWVNGRLPARGLVRMAYFTPTVLPMIAVANIWLFFYTPDIGLVDQILGFFGVPGHNWLGDPKTVLGCIIIMTIWKEAGFFMIFLPGGPADHRRRRTRRGRRARGLQALVLLPAHHLSAAHCRPRSSSWSTR